MKPEGRRAIRLTLVGQGFWVKRLEHTLHRYARGESETTRLSLRAVFSRADVERIRRSDVILRIGYRPGSRTLPGRAFDGFWSVLRKTAPQAAAVHYWIGSDVMRTLRDHAAGRLRSKSFDASLSDYHIADAPWLADELRRIGIRATVLAIPAPNLRAETPPDLPAMFRALTYIPDRRFRLYGAEAVYEAARRLPNIGFDVLGGWGRWTPCVLPNLRFHGWQDNLEPFYKNCCVLLRILEHDSIGVTVKEALSFARHVLCSYPVPHTEPVRFGDVETLVQRLEHLERLHHHGLLTPNLAGWNYAICEFDEARDARSLASFLHQTVCGGREEEGSASA